MAYYLSPNLVREGGNEVRYDDDDDEDDIITKPLRL